MPSQLLTLMVAKSMTSKFKLFLYGMKRMLKFHFFHNYHWDIVSWLSSLLSKSRKKMIVSSPGDYREAARRRLPRFLFDYIDGGAVMENTMADNSTELSSVKLRQRVLCGVGSPTLSTEILGSTWAMPVALGPVGATGMYARRGEVKAARAASAIGIPYTLSTVSVCPVEEVARNASGELCPSYMSSGTAVICVMHLSAPGLQA
ncbi:alpha-hydroxy-acid oxidizing protein [Pantoea ananatis]|uniref:alpha-hydroxy-acid oxidizing protein n=1 Tax=Pantoea ananas TaxID=553 RepID=UPI003AF32B8F